mgnify:CR=1 FL=1
MLRVEETQIMQALPVVADVTIRDDVRRVVRAAIERFGHIDVWVNNAGRGITRMPTELTDSDLDDMVRINVKSVLYGMQEVLPHFKERGSGQVVNISSMQGMIGMNPWLYEGTTMGVPPDYFFHKGGMINLTRHYASLFGPRKVRVNVVSPGGIFNPEKPQPEPFLGRYNKMTMMK